VEVKEERKTDEMIDEEEVHRRQTSVSSAEIQVTGKHRLVGRVERRAEGGSEEEEEHTKMDGLRHLVSGEQKGCSCPYPFGEFVNQI